MRLLPLASALAFALAAASLARADVPPPEGQKRVPYTFVLRGLPAAGDPVVVAYPCGTSDGRPDDVLLLVRDGVKNSVGRRGGACTLYATTKAAYDAWARDAAADAGAAPRDFVKTARACEGGPAPSFEIPTSDPRASIDEVLEVTKLDGAACAVRTVSSGSAGSAGSAGGAGAAATDGGTTGGKGGSTTKSGCAVAPGVAGAGGGLAIFALIAAVARGARRRRAP